SDLPLPSNQGGEGEWQGGGPSIRGVRERCRRVQSMLDRFRLGFSGSILPGKARGHGMQAVEGQLLRFAEIDPVTSSLTLAVGAPVPVPALMASLLAADGKGSERAAHAEAGGRLQPAIPGGGSHTQVVVLSVSLVAQGLPF